MEDCIVEIDKAGVIQKLDLEGLVGVGDDVAAIAGPAEPFP